MDTCIGIVPLEIFLEAGVGRVPLSEYSTSGRDTEKAYPCSNLTSSPKCHCERIESMVDIGRQLHLCIHIQSKTVRLPRINAPKYWFNSWYRSSFPLTFPCPAVGREG